MTRQPHGQTPAEQAGVSPAPDDLPRMTGAEMRVIREALGLTTRWVADHLEVAERSVHRWETGVQPVPDGVADQLEAWEAHAAGVIDRGVAAMMDVPEPVLGVPRKGDLDGWPASWWRSVGAAMMAEVTGLRVVYREDT